MISFLSLLATKVLNTVFISIFTSLATWIALKSFKSTLYYLIKSKKISSEQADDIQELKDDLNEEFSSPDFNKFPNKKYQKLKQLEKTDDPKWELYQVLVTLDRLGNEHVAQRL